jgi:hypothetical protein
VEIWRIGVIVDRRGSAAKGGWRRYDRVLPNCQGLVSQKPSGSCKRITGRSRPRETDEYADNCLTNK